MPSNTKTPQTENTSASDSSTPAASTGGPPSSDPATPATTGTTDTDQPNDSATHPENDGNPNAEAAKYRLRLRETEATLKTAQEALQAAQERADGLAASMVADHAARAGIKPEALTAAGYEAGSFFGEDGTFDPAKLTSAIHETRSRFGIRTGYVPTAGTGSRPVTGPSWSDLLSEGKSRHGVR